MYIRRVWRPLRPGSWEEYERHYRERVTASSTTVKGLRQRQLLRSSEDPDEGVSLSGWNSPDDLVSYERGEFRGTLAREVEHLYQGEYWVKHFEILDTTP